MTKSQLLKLLAEIYKMDGPMDKINGKLGKLPPAKYAALTKRQIEAKWDYPRRHLMHKVACALSNRHRGDAA